MGAWDDELQQQFHRDWFDPEHVEIVLIGGRPAGMIQAESAAHDLFYVSRIEVDPELQNRGVGTALMQHLVARARQSGARAVELHVLELNRARELYERLGFRIVAKEPPNSGCVSRWPEPPPPWSVGSPRRMDRGRKTPLRGGCSLERSVAVAFTAFIADTSLEDR